MRARWKVLGGAGAIGIGLAFWIVGHSREVSGDTNNPTPSSSQPSQPNIGISEDKLHDPTKTYEPGSSAIPYEHLGDADKAAVDHIQETAELAQSDSSHQAFATGVNWSSAEADRQIAARAVGLVGVENDGVVP